MEKITINNLVIATFGNKEDYKLNKDTLPEGAITLVEDNGNSANTNELVEKINTLKTDIDRDMSEFRGVFDDLDNRLRAQKTDLINPLIEKVDTFKTKTERDISESQAAIMEIDSKLSQQRIELINLITEKIEAAKAEIAAKSVKDTEEKE